MRILSWIMEKRICRAGNILKKCDRGAAGQRRGRRAARPPSAKYLAAVVLPLSFEMQGPEDKPGHDGLARFEIDGKTPPRQTETGNSLFRFGKVGALGD
jgi:hypothetical protein